MTVGTKLDQVCSGLGQMMLIVSVVICRDSRDDSEICQSNRI